MTGHIWVSLPSVHRDCHTRSPTFFSFHTCQFQLQISDLMLHQIYVKIILRPRQMRLQSGLLCCFLCIESVIWHRWLCQLTHLSVALCDIDLSQTNRLLESPVYGYGGNSLSTPALFRCHQYKHEGHQAPEFVISPQNKRQLIFSPSQLAS